MKPNQKNIDALKGFAGMLLGVAILLYLGYARGGGTFDVILDCLPWIAGMLVLTFVLSIIKTKRNPKALLTGEKADKGIIKDDPNQTIKVPPSLLGALCDAITVILLVASWILVFRNHLLSSGTTAADHIVFFTALAIVYLVMSYLPKQIGGSLGVRGMKQARQLVIRSHAISLISAVITLKVVINQIHTLNQFFGWMMLVLVFALVILYPWKYLLKGSRFDTDGLRKKLEDIDKDNQE